jgi:hypothetical protein
MKGYRAGQDYGKEYEFSYCDKDLFEGGLGKEWCPLFGELPTIFMARRKHQVADRCIDTIISARDLWEMPYPYLSNGTFLTPEQLALSNPNWPDLDEIPGYEAAILAARSIVWWNHFHIVTNALNYCRTTQVPFPRHWHENGAGILHYSRSSMNHFAQPAGVEKEVCPLLMYPPGSPEEAVLIKYERNMTIQQEARKIPDYLVFAAMAIAEAWDLLGDVLYYGEPEKSVVVQSDLRIADKFLAKAQKAHKLKIKATMNDIEEADKDTLALVKTLDILEKEKKKRQKRQEEGRKTAALEKKKKAKDRYDEWQKRANAIWNERPSYKKEQVAKIIVKSYREERRKVERDSFLSNDERRISLEELDFYFNNAKAGTIRRKLIKPPVKPA